MAAIAAGAGVAAVAAKTHKKAEKKEIRKKEAERRQEYRNTEIGKNEKNSKGIYYSNGNYEAFARPRKPEGVDDKNAYIVGSSRMFPGPGRSDAGFPYSHSGSNGYSRRRLRWHL
jgi:oleate hydratase